MDAAASPRSDTAARAGDDSKKSSSHSTGDDLRNRPVIRRHLRSRLYGQPQGRDRGHHRGTTLREFMSGRPPWTGSAADLLRIGVERAKQTSDRTGWPKNPRALAGHLRRAQTFLRTLGIDITFSREGRAGSRVIRMRTSLENTVSTVSSVSESAPEPNPEQQPRGPASPVCDDKRWIWLAPNPAGAQHGRRRC